MHEINVAHVEFAIDIRSGRHLMNNFDNKRLIFSNYTTIFSLYLLLDRNTCVNCNVFISLTNFYFSHSAALVIPDCLNYIIYASKLFNIITRH